MNITILDCSVIKYFLPLKKAFSTAKVTTNGNFNYLVILTAEVGGRQVRALGEAVPRRSLTGDPPNLVWPFLTAAADHLRGVALTGETPEDCLGVIRTQLQAIAEIARQTVPDSQDKTNIPMRGCFTGIEAALLDLAAQAFDIGIAELLGGTRKPIQVTASTVSAGRTMKAARQMLANQARRFRGWRIKGDSQDETNLEYLRYMTHLNQSKGQSNILWIDFNQALSLEAARAFVDQVVREHGEGRIAGKLVLEQPTPKAEYGALTALQDHADAVRAPDLEFLVMADESLHTRHDWTRLAEAGGCRAINIKVPKAGGLLASIDIARAAIAHDPEIELYIGGMLATSNITAWGIYQLACAMPGFRYTTTVPSENLEVNFADNIYSYRPGGDATIPPPARPGLGSGVDFARLAPLVTDVHPGSARAYLRRATTCRDGAPARHLHAWPEAAHVPQRGLDSVLLQGEALAHGMATQRFSPTVFTAGPADAPAETPAETPVAPLGFWWSAGPFATRAGIEICGQKQTTRRLLRAAGAPVPEGRLFASGARAEARAHAAQLGWPVVVKPAAGSGGRAVSANIRSADALDKALDALRPGEDVIVEKHVAGADYRVLTTDDGVLSVFRWRPARVIGDGTATIDQLVTALNETRRTNPRYRNAPIKLADTQARSALADQGLAPDSVPEKDAVVLLGPAPRGAKGGEGVDVTQETHPSILEAALRARRGLPGLGHCGIDLRMEDHTRPVEDQEIGICEVNACAEIAMHCFPSEGGPVEAAQEIFAWNARRAGVALAAPAWLVSVAVEVGGINRPADFANWLDELATEVCVAVEGLEVEETGARCVLTGWVPSVTALCALAIAPTGEVRAEEVRTRPVATRVLPAMIDARTQRVVRRALISGKVQKVGFRIWMQKQARARGLTGFVRNRSDGTVECVAAGAAAVVEEMFEASRKGPRGAEVTDIKVSDWRGKAPPEKDFLRFKTVEIARKGG